MRSSRWAVLFGASATNSSISIVPLTVSKTTTGLDIAGFARWAISGPPVTTTNANTSKTLCMAGILSLAADLRDSDLRAVRTHHAGLTARVHGFADVLSP